MNSKKLFIPALIALILLLWVWQYLFRLPGIPIDPLEAVSTNTSVVFSFADGRTFMRSNQHFSADSLLNNWFAEGNLQEEQLTLRRVLAAVPGLKDRSFQLLFMLQNAGSGNLTTSAIANVRGADFHMDSLITGIAPERVQASFFRNQRVYRLILGNGSELSLAKYRNLLLVAEYPLLVEESLSRLTKPGSSLLRDDGFKPLYYRQPDGAAFSVFVNPGNFPVLLGDWLQNSGKNTTAQWGNVTEWLRLDFQQEGRLIRLNGGLAPAGGDHLWRAMAGQSAKIPHEIWRIIPENIATVQWLSVSNARKLLRSRSDRFSRYILSWMEDEMAMVGTQSDRLLIFHFTDAEKTEQALAKLGTEAGLLQSYEYQTFQVRQVMEESLFGALPLPFEMSNPYFVVLENYVVFAGSRSSLEVWMDEYIVGKTLAQSPDFLRLYQKLKDKPAQQFVYANLVNLAPRIRDALRTDVLLQAGQPEKSGQFALIFNDQGLSWSMEGYWTPSLAPEATSKTSIAWKTLLESDAITPAIPVGVNPAKPEAIAVQDADFNLYLLHPQGRILWKKKLDGALLSIVHSIQYYGEGSVSLLCNTARNIYLLGMDGEEQGAFPIPLQTPATNGVAVVDFNQNRDYSFFVACANGAIYGFDKLGRPLLGWNPLRGVGEVRHPLLHFQYHGQDYLVVLNEQGRFAAYQRDGSYRISPRNLPGPFPSAPDFEVSQQDDRIVATDRNGGAHIIRMNGFTFRLGLLSDAKAPVRFVFADVTGNEQKDYLALSDTVLTVHYYDNNDRFNLLYRYSFDTRQDEICAVNIPGRDKALVGVISKEKKQIQLMSPEGQPYPDFPLAGDSQFFITDLFGNGQQILVVTSGDSVYTYRIIF